MPSRRSCLSFLLPLVLLIAGVAAAQTPEAPKAPEAGNDPRPTIPLSLDVPDGALVAAGKAPEVDVLYTGDVIGYIEPCG